MVSAPGLWIFHVFGPKRWIFRFFWIFQKNHGFFESFKTVGRRSVKSKQNRRKQVPKELVCLKSLVKMQASWIFQKKNHKNRPLNLSNLSFESFIFWIFHPNPVRRLRHPVKNVGYCQLVKKGVVTTWQLVRKLVNDNLSFWMLLEPGLV